MHSKTLLMSIYGVSAILLELGKRSEVEGYLGSQLRDHYNEAMDAFSQIFNLGEYAKNWAAT
jgi:hypothetical protein